MAAGVHLWFGDDRAVAPEDELSNYRLVQQTLLDRLVALPTVHRIHGELGAPDAADALRRASSTASRSTSR